MPAWKNFLESLDRQLAPERVGRFLLRPRMRYFLAWLLVVVMSAGSSLCAWFVFDEPDRRDGNYGHTTIDFAGQWLMGRMLVEGHGDQLYNRDMHRQLLRAFFPREDEIPSEKRTADKQDKHDVESLMFACMGRDDPAAARAVASCLAPLAARDSPSAALLLAGGQSSWTDEQFRPVAAWAVGGPLYPPVNAFLMVPIASLPPRPAYRLQQAINLLLAFVVGAGLRRLAGGRIWWPLATAAVLAYPGFAGSINLGQNATLTLAVLVWGWALAATGRSGWGGLVWGLLVFKPVWALAFFLVPVLTRRWRMAATMVVCGALLAAATLPVVGIRAWLDWLRVGRFATLLYNTDENWIFLSRDVLSIPRRWLLDFSDVHHVQDTLAAMLTGWALLILFFETTVRLAVLRRAERMPPVGPGAAFVFLGAWLSCFHFMYYDVLLTALPILLLFTEPRRWFEPRFILFAAAPDSRLDEAATAYYRPQPPTAYPIPDDPSRVAVLNSFVLTVLGVMALVEYVLPFVGLEVQVGAEMLKKTTEATEALRMVKLSTSLKGTPWHTFSLMLLWAWCGWQWTFANPASDRRQPAGKPVES